MSEPLSRAPAARGRSVPLSVPRKLVCDLLHSARNIPTIPVQRVFNIPALVAARRQSHSRVSWPVIFTKAYALLCRETPSLRQAYIEYPLPRLYEHPIPVGAMAVEREYQGEAGVFVAYIPEPDRMTLGELDAFVNRQRTEPVEELFAWTLWIYRLPRMLRRFLWWYIINVRGARKAQFLGTFGISVYSSLGAESLHPLSPLTSTLNYGVIDEQGNVTTRIVYDHRVMDGSTIARALIRLEEILNTDILRELNDLASSATGQTTREAA